MPRTLLPLLRRPTAPPVSMLLVLLLGAGWVYRGCSVPVSSRWAPHAAKVRVASHGAVCESAVHVVATDPISEGDRTCDTQASAPDWSFPQVPTRVCRVPEPSEAGLQRRPPSRGAFEIHPPPETCQAYIVAHSPVHPPPSAMTTSSRRPGAPSPGGRPSAGQVVMHHATAVLSLHPSVSRGFFSCQTMDET